MAAFLREKEEEEEEGEKEYPESASNSSTSHIQGYLVHKKERPPLGPP
jgi:hypothetical protein